MPSTEVLQSLEQLENELAKLLPAIQQIENAKEIVAHVVDLPKIQKKYIEDSLEKFDSDRMSLISNFNESLSKQANQYDKALNAIHDASNKLYSVQDNLEKVSLTIETHITNLSNADVFKELEILKKNQDAATSLTKRILYLIYGIAFVGIIGGLLMFYMLKR